jgi:antitoxin (DNA-binding transcriptional repressor) of toxin-antitoxin stability system
MPRALTKVGQVDSVRFMKQVNLCEAKTQLSSLVDQAGMGETIIIAKSGTPVAQLGPLEAPKRKKFRLGLMKGKITFHPGFDDPLPEWLLDAFEGKSE